MATKTVDEAETILKQLGNTPLVKLESLSNDKVQYFAKLESHNPFGSVKDRAAYWMIKDAEDVGEDFAEEARKIHFGEREVKQIYGRTTLSDARDLLDEGIGVLPLPPSFDDAN